MPKGELREAGRFFRAGEDPGYPDFLMLFAEDAGLLSPENGRWVLSKTGPRRLARHSSLLKTLVTFWKDTDRWNEWAADRASVNGRKGRAEELKTLRTEVLLQSVLPHARQVVPRLQDADRRACHRYGPVLSRDNGR